MPPIAILIALADPTRCRIVEILHDGPQPVHVLAGSFKISRPAISRHLRVLKQAKLISEKKTGRENRYALNAEKLKPIADWLAKMRGSEASYTVAADQPPAKKLAPKSSALPHPKPVLAPITAPEAVTAAQTTVAHAARKARPAASVSQMGFDF